ncbi:MAG: DUF814 domain-containing protein [Candidatus Lokiarchaeota archaeon]|nr:DUF814 domain-containing protein [Candidatus Lokiarchaeota archaeon]
MKIQTNFSNFEVHTISKELDQILSEGTIVNVYELENLLILKISTKTREKVNLIVKNDSRINLTDYDYPIPKFPSQYITSLRKLLKNRRIKSVSQYEFDRIIIIEIHSYEEGDSKFVIELFNKGNYLFLDENNIIKIAKSYKKFRDRDVLANREYEFPSQRGIGFLTINEMEFIDVIKDSDDEIVRILARKIGISGLISEELCFRAKIEKTTNARSLNDTQLKEFFIIFKNLRNQLLFGEIKAHIIYEENEKQFAVLPFELEMFLNFNKIYYDTFNQAVDTYYSKLDLSAIKPHQNQKISTKIDAHKRILQNQEEYLQELHKKKEKYYEYGDFIYAHFGELEKLFHVISEAKDKGYNWYEINEKLLDAKKNGVEGVELFIKIIPESRKLIVNILNQEVNLDIRKTIGENANLIYSKGKKAEQKILGTVEAINISREKLTNFVKEKESIEEEVLGLVKKRKQAWYEKFRWFYSSNGFLVIGGRDATSNEVIFKSHLLSEDLVFHTNIPGSPLVVVKNPENKEIPDQTIKEAAIFVGSYSNAWKEDWGYVDVWYVNPNQVSKTPPTGEYLPKGSFMISGKKNVIKNAKTELGMGLEIEESKTDTVGDERVIFFKILCGPLSAIKTQASHIIKIKPSIDGLTKGKLAKEIKSRFINQNDDQFKKWIKLLKEDDIILSLPSGKSIIIS